MTPVILNRRASLFLGTDIQGTSTVSPADWQGFIASEIAPRFPVGFTVQDVIGGYRYDNGQTVMEPTHLLTVIFPDTACPDVVAKLDAIAQAYRATFRQESVLETIDTTSASLLANA